MLRNSSSAELCAEKLTWPSRWRGYSIGTTFSSNSDITTFDELKYFTNVKTLYRNAFLSSHVTRVDLSNITTSQASIFARSYIEYPWMPKVTSLDSGTAAGSGAFYNCKHMVALRVDSITSISSCTYDSTAKYMVCTTSAVPSSASTRIPSKVYVLDSLVSSYQAASNWGSLTIRPLSQLPTDYPDCPWLDDLRAKGFIS